MIFLLILVQIPCPVLVLAVLGRRVVLHPDMIIINKLTRKRCGEVHGFSVPVL
jgi:hypothetical protein